MGVPRRAEARMAGAMDKPLVIRPRLWLLFGAIGAIALVPALLSLVPNPFEGLAPGERPSRFFATLWLLLPILMLLAVWRFAEMDELSRDAGLDRSAQHAEHETIRVERTHFVRARYACRYAACLRAALRQTQTALHRGALRSGED